MSGFAQRLVARGAGRPTGLPLLLPRPATRFEYEPVAPVDSEVPAEAPADGPPPVAKVARKPDSGPAREDAPSKPAKPAGREAGAESGNMGPTATAPQPSHAALPPGRAPSAASIVPDARERMPGAISETTALPGEPAVDEAPEAAPPPLFFIEPSAPLARTPPQIERAPPPPTISIGRIDVQFLPQDRPVAPPRPEPQRTRGFEAYARARRGMPR